VYRVYEVIIQMCGIYLWLPLEQLWSGRIYFRLSFATLQALRLSVHNLALFSETFVCLGLIWTNMGA